MIIKILHQLMSGLQALHAKSIIHRDLKLENVFLTEGSDCKIGDFGLSKKVQGSFGSASSIVGTSFSRVLSHL
jgi:serine/threonine protein kinase